MNFDLDQSTIADSDDIHSCAGTDHSFRDDIKFNCHYFPALDMMGSWAAVRYNKESWFSVDWETKSIFLVCSCSDCSILDLNRRQKRIVHFLTNSDGLTFIQSDAYMLYNHYDE